MQLFPLTETGHLVAKEVSKEFIFKYTLAMTSITFLLGVGPQQSNQTDDLILWIIRSPLLGCIPSLGIKAFLSGCT